MQNTRLNSLFDRAFDRFGQWLRNPWRRVSLLLISVLFGFFLGTAISTVAGQRGDLDIVVAALLLLASEAINWLVYRRPRRPNPPVAIEIANALKIGVIYNLFVEAFTLGS
jgi:hypothetical protein